MDVGSPSGPSPVLDRQQCDDLVSTDEPPVAERHHADVGSPDVFFAHIRYCSERVFAFATPYRRLGTARRQPWSALTALRTYVRMERRDKPEQSKGCKSPTPEGVATHGGPDTCAGVREGVGEALVGVLVGWAIDPRNQWHRGADAVMKRGRQHRRQRYRELLMDPARSKTPGMRGSSVRENREVPWSPVVWSMMPRPGWFAGWQIGGRRVVRGTHSRDALDERLWEVRRPRSTCEAAEQRRRAGGGGGGGKAAGRGERGQQNAHRTQSRGRRVKCAGSRAPIARRGQGNAVHRAAASR